MSKTTLHDLLDPAASPIFPDVCGGAKAAPGLVHRARFHLEHLEIRVRIQRPGAEGKRGEVGAALYSVN